MARRRYLSTEISTDPRVNRLAREYGDFAVVLYTWMIPHAADDATLPRDPEQLLLMVAPGRRDKEPEDVAAAIGGMVLLGLLQEDSDRLQFPRLVWRRISGQPPLHPMRTAWQKIAYRVRQTVFARDGYQCVTCGEQAPLEVDHIQAISRGGTNDLSNLQTLCKRCNRRKWAK